MRLIDKLTHPSTSLVECQKVMKEAAHENARLRSMLFQFLDGGDTIEFRIKVANILGAAHMVEMLDAPTRITDDPMFSGLRDES